jgi:hypothetical protein
MRYLDKKQVALKKPVGVESQKTNTVGVESQNTNSTPL